MTAVVLVITVVLFTLGVYIVRVAQDRRLRRGLVALRLQFPRGLEVEAVEGFLRGVSGMLPPWWRRWLVYPFVVLEVHADHDGVQHFLLVPEAWQAAIENVLQASAPGVRYKLVAPPPATSRSGVEYRLNTSRRPLRVEAESLATKLLTSLQPLSLGERVIVQWVIGPAGPTAPARVATPQERQRVSAPSGVVDQAEAATALRAKQSSALLLASGRVGVTAEKPGRRIRLLRQVDMAYQETRAPGV